jgi:hypothetical protein
MLFCTYVPGAVRAMYNSTTREQRAEQVVQMSSKDARFSYRILIERSNEKCSAAHTDEIDETLFDLDGD